MNQKKRYRLYGGVEISILLAAVAFSIMLAGGFFAGKPQNQLPPVCCDTGDGAACQIQKAKPTIPFNNDQYYLLKSNVTISDTGNHLQDSRLSWSGSPIIVNSSNQDTANCGGGQQDELADYRGGTGTPVCQPIPHNEIIYLCKQNCKSFNSGTYGDGSTVYDVYFRGIDATTPGIPDIVMNCRGAMNPGDDAGLNKVAQPDIITATPFSIQESLQLNAFSLGSKITQWLRPY
jgi:hypothetical protein